MNDPSLMPLASLLHRLLAETGLSLYEVAKRTGINRSTLTRVADGTTTSPDTATLNVLAKAFGVDPEVFYDAAWHETDKPLPSPAVYFRSKYRLNTKQIAELEASLRRVRQLPLRSTPGKHERISKERRSS